VRLDFLPPRLALPPETIDLPPPLAIEGVLDLTDVQPVDILVDFRFRLGFLRFLPWEVDDCSLTASLTLPLFEQFELSRERFLSLSLGVLSREPLVLP
jgi:hypothetical protein